MIESNWETSSTSPEDLRECIGRVLDSIAMAAPMLVRVPCYVLSETVYHYVKTWHARHNWKEIYRAARLLGDRQLAFEKIGDKRQWTL